MELKSPRGAEAVIRPAMSAEGVEEMLAKDSVVAALEALRSFQPDRSRKLVVFLGDTGSGKSTTINYLAGCTMEQDPTQLPGPNGELSWRVAPHSRIAEAAPIGLGTVTSETLIPKVVNVDERINVLDTAGFGERWAT